MCRTCDRVRQLTRRRWPPLNYDDLNHQNIQKFPPSPTALHRKTITNTAILRTTIAALIFAIFYFYFYIRCIHHHRPSSSRHCKTGPAEIRPSRPSFIFANKKTHKFFCDCISAGVRSHRPHTLKKLQLVQGQGYILAKWAREREWICDVREIFRAR